MTDSLSDSKSNKCSLHHSKCEFYPLFFNTLPVETCLRAHDAFIHPDPVELSSLACALAFSFWATSVKGLRARLTCSLTRRVRIFNVVCWFLFQVLSLWSQVGCITGLLILTHTLEPYYAYQNVALRSQMSSMLILASLEWLRSSNVDNDRPLTGAFCTSVYFDPGMIFLNVFPAWAQP